jgi:chromosome segregation ATPase
LANIPDRDKTGADKEELKKLNKEMGDLDRKLNEAKAVFNRRDPETYIKDMKAEINQLNAEIDDNEKKAQKSKWIVNTIQKEQEDISADMNKDIKKLEEVNAKLSKKWTADKGRVEANEDKNTITKEIERLENEKKELITKLDKQEAKNKVYAKLYKWSAKVEKFGTTMDGITNQATLTDKQKSKLTIQAVKDADLHFDVNKQEKKNIGRADLAPDILAALDAKAPSSAPTPVNV